MNSQCCARAIRGSSTATARVVALHNCDEGCQGRRWIGEQPDLPKRSSSQRRLERRFFCLPLPTLRRTWSISRTNLVHDELHTCNERKFADFKPVFRRKPNRNLQQVAFSLCLRCSAPPLYTGDTDRDDVVPSCSFGIQSLGYAVCQEERPICGAATAATFVQC